MNLTSKERDQFTSAQLVYVMQLPDSLVPPEHRASQLAKWARKTPVRLRARLCLKRIIWETSQVIINWAAECDLTDEEKMTVSDLLTPGAKFEDVFGDVVAGKKSLEQRVAALER